MLFFSTRTHGPIAQMVEHRADNAGVSGSIPDGPTKLRQEEQFILSERSESNGYRPSSLTQIIVLSNAQGKIFARQKFWACSSVGRTPALHAGGQEFNSPQVHFSLED